MTSDPTPEDWAALSLLFEQATGADSIPTIETHYRVTESGAYGCVWPGCRFVRGDSLVMWRHVHFAHSGDKNEDPFQGRRKYAELCELAETLGASS